MLMKVESRGGFRGGPKEGSYSWYGSGTSTGINQTIKYTTQEQTARDKFLTKNLAQINALRKLMLEPGCLYLADDNALGGHRFPREQGPKPGRTYYPVYSVRYQEYLKGNNGLQAL